MGTRSSGIFRVTHADDGGVILRNVTTAQVHPLEEASTVEAGEILTATIEAVEPLEVTWRLVEVEDRHSITVAAVDLEPTEQVHMIADELDRGSMTTLERAGRGEIDVLRVDSDAVESAVEEIREDSETVARAARRGAETVEIRSSVTEGIVSVRYLPP